MTANLALRPDGTLARWLAGREGAIDRAGLSVKNATVVSSDVNGMRDLFAPMPTSSGYPVTDYTAMLVSTVYACLSKLGGAVLQLPIHQYRKDSTGDRKRVPASPLWWMLNEQPTAEWTSASWKEWIVRCVHLRGDQHTQIIRSRAANTFGECIGLRPLHPDNCRARRYVLNGEVRLAYDVQDPVLNQAYTVDQDDMLHFTGFGFDGCRGLSVIQHAARNAIGNELGASDYMGKSIGSGAMPKIALSYPNKLSPDQQDGLRKSFVATYGGGVTQERMPLVMTEGGTATPLNIDPVDMELLGSRKFDKGSICEAMGVPPILIGDSEKTSAWGTGIEQITLGFVKFTLKPHLARWEEELNRKLFHRAGQFVEFELDALLRGDTKAQAEGFRFALGGPGSGDGYMSVNEVRKLKNLPALEGAQYDEPFRATRGTAVKPTETEPTNPEATP
jgi:HK97 family phage portal protein